MQTQLSDIENALIQKYGILMSLDDLSELLDRSKDGLRISINTKSSELGQQLKAAKKKIGRRVHFITIDIAKVISQ
ncbi:MAG: DNA-binding protein [Gammaproteobacteria bacterium]|nr:DNA-binding protein [Gammaproteobacteria bacterium]